MKSTLILLATILSVSAFSQTQYGPTNDSLYLGFCRDSIGLLDRPTIIISPFHPDRYMSEFDRDIAKGTNYTYQHTRGFFRKGLDNSLLIAAKEYNDYINLHADDVILNEDLDFLYKVVAQSVVPYEPPVIVESKSFKKKLADYWVKLQTNVENAPEPGTRIENGQIVSVRDTRELITKARVINTIAFDSLAPKYEADYFLFINELDLLNAAANQQAYESENYARVIKVHYSVYDASGKELFSLVKRRYFKSTKNDLRAIITDEILPLGYEVIYSIESYRFLQAGLTPLTADDLERNKAKKGSKFTPLSKSK